MSKPETLLGSKMAEAFEKKKNDINSYVWKGRKVEVNGQFVQEEKLLIDCSEKELNTFYKHCQSMLYNRSEKDPGRYPLLSIVKDQRQRCNTELFLRWLEDPAYNNMPRFKFCEALRGFLNTNQGVVDPKTFPIDQVINNEQCPTEFAGISCDMVMDGCLDRLGRMSKQHLTLSFILKQGVWFSPSESKDLTIKDQNGNIRDRIDVLRENLKLPNTIAIHTNPKGLSYSELRAMVNLKSKKYSELTTDQLRLLRDKILFALEDDIHLHISQWEARSRMILEVMKAKGFALPADAKE